MQIKTKAIVLRAQDYNENDKLLTLLTEKRGLVFAYVFGARKMKSRLSSFLKPKTSSLKPDSERLRILISEMAISRLHFGGGFRIIHRVFLTEGWPSG